LRSRRTREARFCLPAYNDRRLKVARFRVEKPTLTA
jgi:hypothetical protein